MIKVPLSVKENTAEAGVNAILQFIDTCLMTEVFKYGQEVAGEPDASKRLQLTAGAMALAKFKESMQTYVVSLTVPKQEDKAAPMARIE